MSINALVARKAAAVVFGHMLVVTIVPAVVIYLGAEARIPFMSPLRAVIDYWVVVALTMAVGWALAYVRILKNQPILPH